MAGSGTLVDGLQRVGEGLPTSSFEMSILLPGDTPVIQQGLVAETLGAWSQQSLLHGGGKRWTQQ